MQAGLGYAKSDLQLPKYTMVYGSAFVLLLAPAWRILFFALVRKSLPAQQLLFVDCSPTVREIVQQLDERPELGLRAMGYLSEQPCDGAAPGAPYLGPASDLPGTVERRRPDIIVVGTSGAELPSGLLDLRLRGLRVEHASTVYETVFDRVSTRDLNVSQMVFTAHMGPSPTSLLLQDIYSFGLGIVGAVIALPVMAIVAVLIKATSPGPVLYRQQRVGRHGELFEVLKFRSMYSDAEAKTGAVWAQKDDPRVTPLGKWLRMLRLDELPQFLNVIRGQMALVGPRPERPEFVAILSEKIPGYAFRHSVKPGITGWAQINHKYGDTFEDSVMKLEYDLYYIKRLTPAFDAYIILHTLRVVLLQRGAQ
jgi:exopolysaccharide biosynthesis polyprenyl glycosylphosphotransferase